MAAFRYLVILLLGTTLALAQEGGAVVPLLNAKCIDGKPVDPQLESVLVRVDDVTYGVRVSSRENAEAIRKMRPEAALRAVVAFNDQEVAGRIVKPGKTGK